MICLESEMGAVYEMQGHSNQYSGNMFDNITHYESVAEFETLYGQVRKSISGCMYMYTILIY